MDINEAKSLVNRVSPQLRAGWQEKALVDLENLIEVYIDTEKHLAQTSGAVTRWTCASVLPLIAAVIMGFFVRGQLTGLANSEAKEDVIVTITIFLLFMGTYLRTNFLQKRVRGLRVELKTIEGIFNRFAKSVKSLSPLEVGGPSRDVIDEKYVAEMADRLASRVIAAELLFDFTFEAIKKPEGYDRFALTKAGLFIRECQTPFDTFWFAATNDFCVKLDKREIFKAASREYLKYQPNLQKA